jgi:O-acetyl-ADP-ribose deacetylase (regulator of RNase III)
MKSLERIEIVKGDIVRQHVDAIVNAANSTLLGGGGVDGAIHRSAGSELLEECRKLGGCGTGEAKITKGYKLPAKYVIHTVGPVWHGGMHNENALLASCYRKSLALAAARNLKSVAFPSISTGAYGFPMESADRIALKEILFFMKGNPLPEKIVLVCYDEYSLEIMRKAYEEMT